MTSVTEDEGMEAEDVVTDVITGTHIPALHLLLRQSDEMPHAL